MDSKRLFPRFREADADLERALALIGFDADSLVVVDPAAAEGEPGLAPSPAGRAIRSRAGNRTHATGETDATSVAALVEQHHLMVRLAELVAARRLTLKSALMLQRRAELALREERREVPQRWGIKYLVFAGLMLSLVALGTKDRWSGSKPLPVREPPRPAEQTALPRVDVEVRQAPTPLSGEATVDHTAKGRIGRVVGSNPQIVLRDFCRASNACDLASPIELTTALPPQPGLRIGVFTDAQNPGRLLAVHIRKDRRTRRWSVGDGSKVMLFESAKVGLGDSRILVAP